MIALGIEKGIEPSHDNATGQDILSQIKNDIATEIKRLSADDAALSSAISDFKIITFVSIGAIILVIVITTSAKIYGKILVNRATKESIREM